MKTLTPQYLQAYRNALTCAVGSWIHPDGTAQQVFANARQTAVVMCPDGEMFNYSVAAGLFAALSQVDADAAAMSFALEQAQQHVICLSNIPNTATLGQAYNAVIVATGNSLAKPPATDTWEFVTGMLPPGLTLDNGGFSGGIDLISGGQCPVSGVPVILGTFSFTLQVTDPAGDMMQKTFVITVNPIPSGPIQDSSGQDIQDSGGGGIYSA